MDIKGRTALITGGANRVGKSITLALAKAGANVIVNYYSSSIAAEETVKEAEKFSVEGLAIKADISDHKQVENMVKVAQDHFGSVDILVNSADYFALTPFPTRNLSEWHRVIDILINGPFYCANAIAPLMKSKGQGVIINIVDLSAWMPMQDMAAHCIGKAALLALTRQLALELAPTIRCNAVSPGPVLPPPDFSKEMIENMAESTLLDRWGSPEDVANAIIFLIRSDYLTGETITVDGGERYGHQKRSDN